MLSSTIIGSRLEGWLALIDTSNSFNDLEFTAMVLYREIEELRKIKEVSQSDILIVLNKIAEHPENKEKKDLFPFRELAAEISVDEMKFI